ncbi:MAG TPA: TonB-dependent receptor [Terriglobales bacterium]|nr:TonB-dependent receptor [Terriglobales bacterium]
MNSRPGFTKAVFSRALALCFLAFCALPAIAQIDRGAIVGRVTDASGAIVPKATVVVTNKDTGVAVTTSTNESGEYQVLALIPGTYSVRVSSQGFDSVLRDNIALHVQDRLSVEVSLKVGSVSQEIVVTGAEPLLQTETADVGNVVDTQRVNDLPLNGRRYADLALLEPGVQKFYGAANPAPDRFSVNGNLELQNNFRLNGIDNNSWSENLQEFSVQVVQPPPDAIQEFRVQTRTYSSEFGNSAGAVINATLKSGTNNYHGDLFEFVRNSIFDANSWVNKHATPDKIKPKGRFSQNQYGGTFGGPVIKDKTFFFFDMQRFSSRRSTTVQSTVPTPLMKQGNFTELKNTLSDSPVAGQAGCVVGNIIQATCIDPVGSKIAALFPDPNFGPAFGTPGSWTGAPNYIFSTVVPNDTWSLDGRVDHTLNQTNHISGSYSYYHVSRQDPAWTSDPVAGNGNFATQYRTHTQLLSLDWTHNLSNTFLSDARIGFNRDYAHSDPIGLTLGKSLAPTFGLNGIPDTPNTAGLPPIEINGLQRLGTSPWRPQYQISQGWDILENLSWLKGSHSFKFGYEYLKRGDNFLDIRAPQGEPQINGIYTAGGSFGLPDFLLGDVDATHFTTPLVVHYFQPGHSFFAMDTWRATSKLNLTYGVRYELFAPIMSRDDMVSNFTPANGGGITTAAANASGWANRALINPDKNDFAPRVGFAYQLTRKTVFRGGYGVFYQHYNRIGSESLLELNPPFLQDIQLNQGVGSSTPIFLLKNGFPLSTITGTALDLTKLQLRAQDPNQRSGYVEQASFGPEYEIFQNTVLSATYVGNWGRKMNRLRNANQGLITGTDNGCPIVQFPYANLNTVSSIDTRAAGPNCGLTGQHGFLELATNDGNTDYNGLELSLRKRISSGIAYAVNYTYSHGLANFQDNLTGGSTPANAYNYGAEMSNSPFDIRHRFVSNFTWDLPIGKGRRFLSGDNLASNIIGGWQFNGIVTLQTGTPFTVTTPDLSFTGSNHASYPNCVGDPFAGATGDPASYTTTGFFINPAAFAFPTRGTFGTCRPRAFHGPGIQMTDLSLFKMFRMTERFQWQFRAEFFNAFNHPNFANPNASFTAANIGANGSFGKVSNTLNPILGTGSGGPGDPREIQLALKLYF